MSFPRAHRVRLGRCVLGQPQLPAHMIDHHRRHLGQFQEVPQPLVALQPHHQRVRRAPASRGRQAARIVVVMDRDPLELLAPGEHELLRPWRAGQWVEPMAASVGRELFDDPAWLFEPKLDGVRVLAARDDSGVALFSRTRRRVDAAYPEIAEVLGELPVDRFLVDGEIVAFDGPRTSFAALQNRMNLTSARAARATGVPVHLYVFDMVSVGGVDLRELSLRTRKRLLAACFTFGDAVHLNEHHDTDGRDSFRNACEHGWEGVIGKRADSRYRSGRSDQWLKFKCVSAQEFVVGGFTEPRGSRSGFGALLVGYFEGTRLRYAGKVGTGYDAATLRKLRAELDARVVDESPFADRVAERAHWVRPELVVQVTFTEWTRDGRLRQPSFTGLRRDKRAGDVVRE